MGRPLEREILPSVNVTDDGVAYQKAWFAALVKTNCERTVADKLTNISVENFVAVQEEMHRWSDRMKKVQRVVIPNIVFVRISKDQIDEVKRLSFIRGLMTQPGVKQPAEIPEHQMQMLKFMLQQSDTPVYLGGTELRRMKVGEQVRIIRGPLKNVEGVIFRTNDKEIHVGILIAELGMAHAHISVNDIEVIKK